MDGGQVRECESARVREMKIGGMGDFRRSDRGRSGDAHLAGGGRWDDYDTHRRGSLASITHLQRDLSMTTPEFPYTEHESTRTWSVIEQALEDLQENGDLTLTTAPQHVIGYLCQQLAAAGLTEMPPER
jgi:hypothetical protein